MVVAYPRLIAELKLCELYPQCLRAMAQCTSRIIGELFVMLVYFCNQWALWSSFSWVVPWAHHLLQHQHRHGCALVAKVW